MYTNKNLSQEFIANMNTQQQEHQVQKYAFCYQPVRDLIQYAINNFVI